MQSTSRYVPPRIASWGRVGAAGSMNCGNSAAKNITANGLALEVMKPWRNSLVGEAARAAVASDPRGRESSSRRPIQAR